MKVFISHTPTDEALARQVATVLQESGLDVWDERTEITPGENWAAKVAEALRESEAMVVLLTPEALRSSWVRRDIEYALSEKRYNQRLIPVLVPPSSEEIPQEEIPWILRRLKMIKLAEEDKEDSIKQIAQVLLDAA
jgi:hypothetical protein